MKARINLGIRAVLFDYLLFVRVYHYFVCMYLIAINIMLIISAKRGARDNMKALHAKL